jgi:uncharacterized protein YdeI (YjbR/CyaY-like superfamily)
VAPVLPELLVADAAAWRAWLAENCAEQAGVWLALAKKGKVAPTTLDYEAAVEEAVCFGWIDGQIRRKDEGTYLARFTPRRARSPWSRSNVERVERLLAAGRMCPPGIAEVDAAKADGRWAAATEQLSGGGGNSL